MQFLQRDVPAEPSGCWRQLALHRIAQASRTCRNSRSSEEPQASISGLNARYDAHAKLSRQIYDSERYRYFPRITISYDPAAAVPSTNRFEKRPQQQAHRHCGSSARRCCASRAASAPAGNPPNTSHDSSNEARSCAPDVGRTGFRRTARRSATSASAAKPTAMVRTAASRVRFNGGNAQPACGAGGGATRSQPQQRSRAGRRPRGWRGEQRDPCMRSRRQSSGSGWSHARTGRIRATRERPGNTSTSSARGAR